MPPRTSKASVKLEGLSTDGSLHTAPPIVNVRHFPRLAAGRHDEPQVHELVRSRSRDRAEVKRLSGTNEVPILVLDDGEVVSGSGEIARWAQQHPA